MKRSFPALLFLLLSLLPGLAEPTKSPGPKPLKALLFVGGCCHDYDKLAPHLSQKIGEVVPIHFEVKLDLDPLKNENFADGYDVIVYDVCFEEADKAQLQNAFQATRKGKPTVMIHCAIHAFRKSEQIAEWEKLCGLRSKVHDPYQAFSVEKVHPNHPVINDFPSNWKTAGDELYQVTEFLPDSVPLLKVKSPHDGREHIVCWVHRYGAGRVFATTLGHDMKTAESPDYIKLLANGILWACRNPEEQAPSQGK